jgi:hypothetical protein
MGTRHAIPVFEAIDMTVSDVYTLKTSTNYGIFLQMSWTGLAGESSFKVQGSINGVDFSDYPLNDCGVCIYEKEIMGAADNVGFVINNWFPDHFRVVFTSNTATSGELNALVTIIDNQDVST